ncbi:hypothetical protein H4Q26_007891 [Puccinia striiformis f. sp. tritici PST-130]|nr:hypothetical protein H4Q26_007891 [Puccinia striiformis f. sp. tritici PST-130]
MRYILVLSSIMFLWTAEVWSINEEDQCSFGSKLQKCRPPKSKPLATNCLCCINVNHPELSTRVNCIE